MNSKEKWKQSLRLEQHIAYVQSQQELHGVLFNVDLAYDTLAEIDDEMSCIESKILSEVPKRVVPHGAVITRPFKKDGSNTKMALDWLDKHPLPKARLECKPVGGQYTRIDFIPMNLNSIQQVKDYLLAHGWKPTEWNTDDNGEKTSPKLTEDSYDSIDSPIPKLIARYNVIKHRRNTICNIKDPFGKGWLALLRDDGRLEAQAFPQATNTGRYRHRVVVNVPKASDKVVYGKRMRELFIVPEGKLMLGCDAAALEARMEAHYCYPYTGGVEYAHELLEGDIHAKNAKLFGTDRDGAKAPKYAMTYGAQPPKIAETLGIPFRQAKRLYESFWAGNTALAEFRDAVTTVWEQRGYLYGIDGRKIRIRSKHAIVNAMFQSAGSITVKVATLFLNKWVRDRGIDAHQILHMHDEFQWEIRREDEEVMTELALKAFEQAGNYLNMRVPILGDVKIGKNWAETH